MRETFWCIEASCRKRTLSFLLKNIFVWLVHTCQGVPMRVGTTFFYISSYLPPSCGAWGSNSGHQAAVPSVFTQCAILLAHPPPHLSFQGWLYSVCWCQYLSIRYLKKGLWILHRQKEGFSRISLLSIPNWRLSLIRNLGECGTLS